VGAEVGVGVIAEVGAGVGTDAGAEVVEEMGAETLVAGTVGTVTELREEVDAELVGTDAEVVEEVVAEVRGAVLVEVLVEDFFGVSTGIVETGRTGVVDFVADETGVVGGGVTDVVWLDEGVVGGGAVAVEVRMGGVDVEVPLRLSVVVVDRFSFSNEAWSCFSSFNFCSKIFRSSACRLSAGVGFFLSTDDATFFSGAPFSTLGCDFLSSLFFFISG
jgi:hypothetical protein